MAEPGRGRDRNGGAAALAEGVSADKAYLSADNLNLLDRRGIDPYIPFKSNSVLGNTPIWDRIFHYFNLHREEFLAHYHKRSNVESTFSMVKRKFGDSLRSKTDTAMVNETLAKLLAHNVVVVIHKMYELGIDLSFGAAPPAHEPRNILPMVRPTSR